MHRLKAIIRNPLLISLVLIPILGILGVMIVRYALHVSTHHGEKITVPDFSAQSLEDVKEICDRKELRYEIEDTAYVKKHA